MPFLRKKLWTRSRGLFHGDASLGDQDKPTQTLAHRQVVHCKKSQGYFSSKFHSYAME